MGKILCSPSGVLCPNQTRCWQDMQSQTSAQGGRQFLRTGMFMYVPKNPKPPTLATAKLNKPMTASGKKTGCIIWILVTFLVGKQSGIASPRGNWKPRDHSNTHPAHASEASRCSVFARSTAVSMLSVLFIKAASYCRCAPDVGSTCHMVKSQGGSCTGCTHWVTQKALNYD